MIAFISLLGVADRCASAALLYQSGSFEPPRFSDGADLEFQDVVIGPWLQTGTSTAVVQTTNTNGGFQSIQVSRAASVSGDSRWWVNRFVPGTNGRSIVHVDVDLKVMQSAGVDFGPFFGLEAYDAFTLPTAPRVMGSVGLDAATGDVLYQKAGSGELAETGTVLSRGAYHSFRLRVDLAFKRYDIYADGNLLHTELFVDDALVFSDAPISTLAATADTVTTATGTAYFDNYQISNFLIADANADSLVDVLDLGILATNYQLAIPNRDRSQGDFNRDGVVDVLDLGILATYYGESLPENNLSFQEAAAAYPALAADATSLVPVPEPGAIGLVALGGLGLLRRRRGARAPGRV